MKKTLLKLITAALACTMMLTGCATNGTSSSATESVADTTAADTTAADTTAAEDTTAADTTAADETAADESLQKVLDAGEFILGLDATFKPMGYTDENDNIVGFDVDVAKEVCARLGVELKLQPINWETKEQDLNAGTIDCIWNGMSVSAERAEAMNLSEAYMKNAMVFVVKADSTAASQADLTGKNIAVQGGSTAQEILEASDLASSITVAQLATNVEALQQLELGIVDSVFLDSVVAQYEITTMGKDYVILPDGLEEEEYAIGFRKNDCTLRDKVQAILSEMKADGKLGEIATTWFGSDITTVQ